MPDTPDLQLADYVPRSELVVDQHPVERSRFPAIDAHNHLGPWHDAAPETVQQLVDEMDACNLRAYVDLDGGRRHPLSAAVTRLKEAHPGRFYVLTVLPWEEIVPQGGDIGAQLATALERAVDQGADGLKIHKTLGLRLRDEAGQLIMPHDERLAPLFARCGELEVPCLYHVADPVAFFRPLDRHNERWEELAHHPDWHFYGGDLPSFEALMESQERLLEAHPGTLFQSAHVASYAENLGWVSQLLDRYPNLYVDISARLAELGRQPFTARDFLVRHADRVLYGTDSTPNPDCHRIYYRCLETRDEHFPYSLGDVPGQGRWTIYGLDLPDDVLEKMYWRNAAKLYGQSPR